MRQGFKLFNILYIFKLLKLSLVAAAAIALIALLAALPDRLCFHGGEGYTFYCGTSSSDCREVTADGNAAAMKLYLKNVCGEGTFYRDFDLDGFLKQVGGKIVFEEAFCDGVNYYCTANLPYSVEIYGKTINLHISVKGNAAKVASPIIFGGY